MDLDTMNTSFYFQRIFYMLLQNMNYIIFYELKY